METTMIINGLRYELEEEGRMDPKGIYEGDITIYHVTKLIENSVDRHMGYRAFGLGLEVVTNGPGLSKARAKLGREKAFRDQEVKNVMYEHEKRHPLRKPKRRKKRW